VTTASHCLSQNNPNQEPFIFITGTGTIFKIVKIKQDMKNADVARVEVVSTQGSPNTVFLEQSRLDPSRPAMVLAIDPVSLVLMVARGHGPKPTSHPGILEHQLDTLPGSSGSAILQGHKVVALHVGGALNAEGVYLEKQGDFLRGEKNVAVDLNQLDKVNLPQAEEALAKESFSHRPYAGPCSGCNDCYLYPRYNYPCDPRHRYGFRYGGQCYRAPLEARWEYKIDDSWRWDIGERQRTWTGDCGD
jgi:hypothetical protein